MLRVKVLDKLILAVVPDFTQIALVWLVISVSTLVIILIAYSGKCAWAVATLIRFLTSVDSHMHKQISPLIEILLAPHALKETVAASSCLLHSHRFV